MQRNIQVADDFIKNVRPKLKCLKLARLNTCDRWMTGKANDRFAEEGVVVHGDGWQGSISQRR